MRTPLLASLLLGVVAVAAAWVMLAPPALGGQTSYVVTRGESMLPSFHTGDLILVRAAAQYRTGDVIAYRSPTLDIVVLHRVVAERPDGLVTRGDNNDFTDPDVIAPQRVMGRLWLHFPEVGAALSPMRAALPLLVVPLVLYITAGTARPLPGRRFRSQRGTLMHPASVRRLPVPLTQVATGLLAVAAALLLLSLRAPSTPPPSATSYSHLVEVTYTAPADPLVYDGGELRTGDPVFASLNPQVGVDVHYELQGVPPDGVQGTLGLSARLSGSNGLQRVLPLATGQPLLGGQADLRAPLDIAALQVQLATLQERTGTADGSYRLELLPVVQASGQVGGQKKDLHFAPAIGFRLQAGQLILDAAGHERGLPITATAKEAVEHGGPGPARLRIVGLFVPVSQVRLAGVALGTLGLALSLVALGRRRADPLSRLDRPVVSVSAHELSRPALELSSLNALLDLAQRYDRPVLHVPTVDGPVYLVEEGGTWYRHSVLLDQAREPVVTL